MGTSSPMVPPICDFHLKCDTRGSVNSIKRVKCDWQMASSNEKRFIPGIGWVHQDSCVSSFPSFFSLQLHQHMEYCCAFLPDLNHVHFWNKTTSFCTTSSYKRTIFGLQNGFGEKTPASLLREKPERIFTFASLFSDGSTIPQNKGENLPCFVSTFWIQVGPAKSEQTIPSEVNFKSV